MEIVQFRHFLRLADRKNFTRAAVDLGLSQSALSRSIARLEAEIGRPLFERQTRTIALTDAGQLLLDRVRRVVQLVDDLASELVDDDHAGIVRIGAIPTVAPYFLPECLLSFREQDPAARIIVQEETTQNLLKKLTDGEVDLIIAALPLQAKYIDIAPLFDEELFLVTGPTHALARKRTVTVADLADHPFVLLGEAHCLTEQVVQFCRQTAIQPVSVERAVQLAMVQELVALGHGISLVPAMARARDTHPNRIYRSLTGTKPTRTIALATNPYRYHNTRVRRFREHVIARRSAKRS